jgi:hypothetical protein
MTKDSGTALSVRWRYEISSKVCRNFAIFHAEPHHFYVAPAPAPGKSLTRLQLLPSCIARENVSNKLKLKHTSSISEVDTKFRQKFAEISQFFTQSRIIFTRLQLRRWVKVLTRIRLQQLRLLPSCITRKNF